MIISYIVSKDHKILNWAPYSSFSSTTAFANAVNAQCGKGFGPGNVQTTDHRPQDMVNSDEECIRII